ncbi:bromo adjacent y domain containing 1, partial [Datura stramonium]|nr:bromo adjacent y domain containing 1 [Datura stramonium]
VVVTIGRVIEMVAMIISISNIDVHGTDVGKLSGKVGRWARSGACSGDLNVGRSWKKKKIGLFETCMCVYLPIWVFKIVAAFVSGGLYAGMGSGLKERLLWSAAEIFVLVLQRTVFMHTHGTHYMPFGEHTAHFMVIRVQIVGGWVVAKMLVMFYLCSFAEVSLHTIEGKCIVHSFKNYTKLENVGPEDYHVGLSIKRQLEPLEADRVAVYCKCEMPYNPDDLMVQCEECKDWYHPACVGMTSEQAKQLADFVCSDCSSEDVKKSLNTYAAFPLSNGKVK